MAVTPLRPPLADRVPDLDDDVAVAGGEEVAVEDEVCERARRVRDAHGDVMAQDEELPV